MMLVIVSSTHSLLRLAPRSSRNNMGVSSACPYAAFSCTSTDLVPGQIDDNQRYDVFLYDRIAGSTLLVTHAAGSPATAASAANDQSFGFALSSNGRYVVFESRSTVKPEPFPEGAEEEYRTMLEKLSRGWKDGWGKSK